MGRLQRIAAAFGLAGAASPRDHDNSWSADDLAERIGGGCWQGADGKILHEPNAGHVDIVRAVTLARGHDGRYRIYLSFARWPDSLFDAGGFRKLTPHADAATAADAAFIRRLKHRAAPAPSLIDRLAARLERILS